MNKGQENALGVFLSLIVVEVIGVGGMAGLIGMLASFAYWKLMIWWFNKE